MEILLLVLFIVKLKVVGLMGDPMLQSISVKVSS